VTEVRSWSVDLTDPRLRGDAALAVLDDEERARWEGFLRDESRVQFAAAHTALRFVLAAEVGASPTELALVRAACPRCGGDHGRPELRGSTDVHFSLSHTQGWAYIAISRGEPVGIDVEKVRANRNNDGISRRFFSESEQASLATLPADERVAAFYRLWVRKEAVLKGSGHGLSGGLAIEAGSAVVTGADAQLWLVSDLDGPKAYAAAVAVADPEAEIRPPQAW
jgi:4'-phosphopantetheinyl transferase